MSRPFLRCRHRAADADRGRLRAADDRHHAGTISIARRAGTERRAFAVAAAATEAATAAAAITVAATAAEAATAATSAEAAATTAEAATITTVAALVAVALAHHHRRLGLVRFDLDGEVAQHLGREAHTPLHFGHGRGRGIDVEQREVRLAALLDLVGEAFDAPVLALGDLAATLLDEVGEFFGQRLDLSVRDVLARQEDMLV